MIDWERVTELKEEIGKEEFDEIVEIFLEEVEESLTELGAAPADANLRDIMHFLKGSALNLGFRDFADLCQRGEAAAAAGGSDQIDRGAIQTCYGASRELLLSQVNAAHA